MSESDATSSRLRVLSMSVGTRRGRTSHDFSGSPSDSISAKRSSFSSSFSMGLSEWDGFSELGRQLLHSPAVLPPSLTRELVSINLRNALMAVRLQRKEKRANLGAHDGHPASRHLHWSADIVICPH